MWPITQSLHLHDEAPVKTMDTEVQWSFIVGDDNDVLWGDMPWVHRQRTTSAEFGTP